jgi:hypothetical protein
MSRERFHRVVVTLGPRVVGIITSLDALSRFPAESAGARDGRTPKKAPAKRPGAAKGTAKASKKPAPKAPARARKAGRAPVRASGRR